jgi:hypothetical protein
MAILKDEKGRNIDKQGNLLPPHAKVLENGYKMYLQPKKKWDTVLAVIPFKKNKNKVHKIQYSGNNIIESE